MHPELGQAAQSAESKTCRRTAFVRPGATLYADNVANARGDGSAADGCCEPRGMPDAMTGARARCPFGRRCDVGFDPFEWRDMSDDQSQALQGRRVAVPESRQLDLFAQMLESRGAVVHRCPLVEIRDAPDPAPIEAWLEGFAAGRCDDLILLTGEGLRRLLGFAERAGGDLHERFVARLGQVRKITRGPKPARALREIGLRTDIEAAAPTTDGVIDTLTGFDLGGRCVGLQLYGTEPNDKLQRFLSDAGAEVEPVYPYVYADQTEDEQVVGLIEELTAGGLDAIAFTSSPQVRRLFTVARRHGKEDELGQSLRRIVVAAVGPLVADALKEREVRVDVVPGENFFMKPLVRELMTRFGA